MTVLKASRSQVTLGMGKPIRALPAPTWVRPSDWLTLTAPGVAEQKFVGLIAVFNQTSNYIALRCATSAGTYTVDWGDGTSPVTVTSGTTAEYNYAWSSIGSGTLTTFGYRQAVVTITPTTGGATFSEVMLNFRHTARTSSVTVAPWLDIAIAAPNATVIQMCHSNDGEKFVAMNFLQQVIIVAHNTTFTSYLFWTLRSLQSVPLFNTAAVTEMANMFHTCSSLQTVPLFNTGNVTTMNAMFQRLLLTTNSSFV